MFIIVELLYGIGNRGKGKEKDRESTISMQVEDIMICTQSC
jgi:hypothetical protein